MNAQEFIYTLYKDIPSGWIEVTYIAPKGVTLYPRTVVHWRELPLHAAPDNIDTVLKLNNLGYGCYFGVAARVNRKHPEQRTVEATGETYTMQYPRGTAKDALYLPALWVDIDAKDYAGDMQIAYDKALALKPSIVVESGGGYQAYILLDTPLLITDENRDVVKRTLKGLATLYEADTHAAELARVMRIPDTVNTKPERNNALAKVVYTSDTRMSFTKTSEAYALPEYKPTPIAISGNEHSRLIENVERALACIPANAITYDEWLAILAGLTHSLGENTALSLALNWSGWCSKDREIEAKIASVRNNGRATIATVFFIARKYGYGSQTTNSVDMSNSKRKLSALFEGQL